MRTKKTEARLDKAVNAYFFILIAIVTLLVIYFKFYYGGARF